MFDPKQSKGSVILVKILQTFVDNKGPLSIIVYIYMLPNQVFDPIGTNWTQNNLFRYFKKSQQIIASEQCKHDT